MSLKAKLEAVIYAAEEPVTLAQLAALFAADALEWKAEQEAASAKAAPEADPAQPLLTENFDYAEAVLSADEDAPIAPDTTAETVSNSDTPLEASPETPSEAPPETDQPPATASADEDLEARRLARQRDREVKAILHQLLDELIASYAADSRGIEIREIAGGYRLATKPECHDAVRQFVRSLKPALKLSLPALETLAVIAYKQPVTAPEVNEIRGVESSGVFGSLLARKLIATAGRKQVIGRPILYKTTREFLLRFGLKDVAELPSMEEFEKLAAIELDEPETGTEPEAANSQTADTVLNSGFEEDADETDDQDDENLLMNQSDAGPQPAFTGDSEEPVAPVPALEASEEASESEVELPESMPAVMAAQESAETTAVTAAETSAPTEPTNPAE